MPKLPAYVFRRQNGSYRYKRNVPKKLRPLIGKDTLYRQLGESYSEAMTALPKVHLEIEQLFAAEEMMPANERLGMLFYFFATRVWEGAVWQEFTTSSSSHKCTSISRKIFSASSSEYRFRAIFRNSLG